jgi:L-amino acid N-acyltransferase
MNLRPATEADCTRITDIWNPLIRETDITFNSREKTVASLWSELQQKVAQDHPFLVATEADNRILGFATYAQFRTSNGYRRTMEHTIILPQTSRGRGVGRLLMAALEDHARARDVHSMFAGISHRNPEAIAFHAALGYAEVARLPEVGYKFNRWCDLVLMQKIL